jgi:hypothetical protein
MEFPQHVLDALDDIRNLDSKYNGLARRKGTNGEKGLFPQMRSVRAQIGAIKKQLKKENPNLEFVMAQAAGGDMYCIKVNQE